MYLAWFIFACVMCIESSFFFFNMYCFVDMFYEGLSHWDWILKKKNSSLACSNYLESFLKPWAILMIVGKAIQLVWGLNPLFSSKFLPPTPKFALFLFLCFLRSQSYVCFCREIVTFMLHFWTSEISVIVIEAYFF